MTERGTSISTHHEPSRFKIALAYLSVFIVWGSTYLAIRIGVQDLPPALFAGSRFFISGIAMYLFARATGRSIPYTKTDLRRLAIVGIFLLVGGNGLVVWSEQWVHSGLAALIIATVPLFMSSIDSLTPGGHRLSRIGWAGIVIGFAGVGVLVSPSLGLSGAETIKLEGVIGLVAASFFWSVGSVYSKHRQVKGDIVAATGLQMLFGGTVLSIIGISTGELGTLQPTVDGLLALLYLIIFGSIIGFTSYAYLLRHVPPAKASTYAYVNPIVAVILGAIVLHEPVEPRTVAATVVILGGVGLVQLARMRQTP